VGLARGDRKRPLNEGRIPNPNGVRVHESTRYIPREGNPRASRTGLVGDRPSRNESHTPIHTFSHRCMMTPVSLGRLAGQLSRQVRETGQ
jgi:hypothetical protein